MVAKRIDKR